ncbi:4'-phosphopantetheinyl transferase superfamily protein [Cryobacterium sp. SO1]|uniref:4'-phosphopantetheinyl transferase family protein n=1 Tax=Cryobacterium sp. SO1 TaxID=1897061 RepID=UPI00102369BB|nr:4'-phosphopantetheinyl transferase superfamily protein [Cryobacterium sp. SO1]RZI34094.1 hypothetical protein BJQ95_03557 [Cryobacterium sp. SO1]
MHDAPSPRPALRDDLGEHPHEHLSADLQAVDLTCTVVVALGSRAAARAEDHRSLAHLVARLVGVDAASVCLTQLCPTCERPGHGPLRVQLRDAPAASATVHVSLARSGDLVALAVTAAGPVGIDLESLADLARAPLDDVALSPAEAATLAPLPPAAAASALAAVWTTKEAVLKAAELGFRADPRELTVTLEEAGRLNGRSPGPTDHRTVSWPEAPFPDNDVQVWPVDAPRGTVATVVVVCSQRPALVMVAAPTPPR